MTPSGGGRPVSRALLQTSQSELEVAWKEREEEASQLTAQGSNSTALALRIYSLEIRVKAIICKQLKLSHLPAACKTHDLSELFVFTGMLEELEDPANSTTRQNWDLLVDFSKVRLNEQRYLPRVLLTPVDLARYTEALDNPQDGVLAWLSRHP
jgi:hypothetical protein